MYKNRTSSAARRKATPRIARRLQQLTLLSVLLSSASHAQSASDSVSADPSPNHQGAEFDDSAVLIQDAVALIERRASEGLARDGMGGLTVGIVIADELVWTKSYGHADDASSRPATRDTIYPIASITKSFTGLMLAQLVERGHVNYSDAVVTHLPEFKDVANRWSDGSPISLLQLATMIGGIQREPSNLRAGGYLLGPAANWGDVTRRALAETSVEYEPGTRYSYSNIGYAILGLALEQPAKKPFITYQIDEILTPLGMHETAFELSEELRPRLATGYVRRADGSQDASRVHRIGKDHGYGIPGGGLYSTVDDLARFVSLQLGCGPKGVLGSAALARTHTGFQSNGDLSYGYGIGLTATRRDGMVLIGNLGGLYGFASAMYFHPKTQLGLIVLHNATGAVFREDELCFDALEAIVKKVEPQIDRLAARAASAFEGERWGEAAEAYSELRDRSSMNGRDHYQHGQALMGAGADLPAIVDAFRTSFEFGYQAAQAAYNVAAGAALLGDVDGAIEWLIKARNHGELDSSAMALDPNLDSIREDPRFVEYMSQF